MNGFKYDVANKCHSQRMMLYSLRTKQVQISSYLSMF